MTLPGVPAPPELLGRPPPGTVAVPRRAAAALPAAHRCYGNGDFLQRGLPVRAASDARGCRRAGETPARGDTQGRCRGAMCRVPARGGDAAEQPPAALPDV